MRRLTRSVMIGTWALALTTLACGEAEPESTHRFDVETIDGVEVAITRGGPRFTEPLFTLEEQLTLVQEMSDEESLLYRPRGFARGADGNYYVADSGNGRIAVFSDTGRFLRAIGREGQGPGEFSDSIVLQGDPGLRPERAEDPAIRVRRHLHRGRDATHGGQTRQSPARA